MDFAELRNDAKFIETVGNISASLDKIEEHLKAAVEFKNYEALSTQDKVKYDSYLSYSINSLFWMYLKLKGVDPNNHAIKNELARVRQAMVRDKQIYERNTIRPVIDKGAAGRFVRHGLHDRSNRKDKDKDKNDQKVDQPKNKKIKFDDSD